MIVNLKKQLREQWKDLREVVNSILANVVVSMLAISVIYLFQYVLDVLNYPNDKKSILISINSVFRNIVIILLVLSSLTTIFVYVIRLAKKGSSQVTQLRKELRDAYIKALDDSSLNPKRAIGDKHV